MATPERTAQDTAAEWKHEVDVRVVEARESLATASESAIAFIKERPVLCLAGALAAGYIFGRIVRR